MNADACPKCGGSAITAGWLRRRGKTGSIRAGVFEPDDLQWFQFRLRSGIPVADPFRACLTCGHVWSHVSPDELRAFIEKHGTDEAKSHLPQGFAH